MKKKEPRHSLDALAALLLFGVFAVCVLAVLLTGAKAYRRLTQRDQLAYDRSICLQYIAAKVRQSDRLGEILVEDFQGSSSLVLEAGQDYSTWIYCREGWLMELYCYAAERLAPEEGRPLMELGDLSFSLEGGLLTINLTTPQGERERLVLSLRCGEGERP